jgi:NAD-reducing hydrogenase small subunit
MTTKHVATPIQADAGPSKGGKIRLATVWLGGCSGCHMSFLDLDEHLIDLFAKVDLVYSPIADVKEFPENVDVTLVEGAVANVDHVKLVRELRARSKIVVSFGDCAVTGNVTSLRNRLNVDDLLNKVYQDGPGAVPRGNDPDEILPALIERVVPLHQVIAVDAYIPGCPPDPDRILAAVSALLAGDPVVLAPAMRLFG